MLNNNKLDNKNNKKKALYIANAKLMPEVNGALIYSMSIIKHLHSSGLDVTLVNLYIDEPYRDQELKELKKYCSDVIEIKHTNTAYIKNLSIKYPITIKKYYTKEMVEVLTYLGRGNYYDFAFFDHLHMGTYLPYVKARKKVLIEHNVETEIWKSYYDKQEGVKKILVGLYGQWMASHEKKYLSRFNHIVAISDGDKENLKKLEPSIDCHIFRPKIEIDRVKSDDDISETNYELTFVGSYSWFPNQEAAMFLGEQLMPELRKKGINVKLTLVGISPTEEMVKMGESYDDIEVTGRVESIDPYIKSGDLFINAIESGSGMNIKIVEAMGKGIPIISSEFGIRGFGVKNGNEVWLYKDMDELVSKIEELLKHPDARVRMVNQALEFYNEFINDTREFDLIIN